MANTKTHPAEQYAQQVRNKEILTCELVQLAVQRSYRDRALRRCGSRLPHQVLRPAGAGRGVVPHRRSSERLIPGAPEYDKSRSNAALGGCKYD